ncbi:MAG: mannose-1-phosphate guanylyltransferase [Cyclobacteriaceae bacterium]|nr:mannose-1-phosphate guanylyltransferase [Cyclobacteriaceae bacterium]
MMKNNFVVIMAGGTGTRFWPYSRQQKPKQFLDILGVGKSLLQLTFERFSKIIPEENIYIITNEQYSSITKEQLPQISNDQILLEPFKKNTAPCIAYASSKIIKNNKNAKIVVSPSDHAIFNVDEFNNTILAGLENADDKRLITIGINPTRPETGYGYIQYKNEENLLKRVKTFTEKPTKELAEKFIESGDYVWNAGIFIWKATAILAAFEEYLPEIYEAFSDIEPVYFTSEEQERISEVYMLCKNISVDYAIMEKSNEVHVLLGDFTWLDLGHWSSLHESMEKDKNENVVQANALLYDVKNTMIKGDDEKMIVVEGLEDYVVADCDNVLLICKKNNEAKMREFVNDVKSKKGEGYL